jgi:thioredoxin-like negative regulator of GroEL
MPDEAPLHVDVGRLFASANDDARALEQFQRAIALDPSNRTAMAGAGMAAFRLGDYARAQSYLGRLPAVDEDVRSTREIVDLVLSRDPLAAHIGSAERRRRLAADVADTHERLRACVANAGSNDALAALDIETQAFEAELARATPLEQDTVEAGVDLVDRLDRTLGQRCVPTTTLDRALALIGRKHTAESR